MGRKTVRIFISSPGDVGEEREIARKVLRRLQGRFADYLNVEPIIWEWEPILANADPQSQLVRPSQTDIVVCILWARFGTPLPERFRKPDGSLYNSGTEFELEDAAVSYRERGVPSLLMYRKTSDLMVQVSNKEKVSTEEEEKVNDILRQRRMLHEFIERWCRGSRGEFKTFYHEFRDPAEFEQRLEAHIESLLRDKVPAHMAQERPERIQWTAGSPFRGLQPFETEHREIFFGRTKAISQAKEALLRQAASGTAFLLIQGASGSGKSSFFKAGLIPTLTELGVIEGVRVWRWAVFRPSAASPDGPLVALADSLFRALPGLRDSSHSTATALAGLLREAPGQAPAVLDKALNAPANAKGTIRLILGIDQFEELFSLPETNPEVCEEFAAALESLARCGWIWIIATLRSDAYARFAARPELLQLKKPFGQYDLLPPSQNEFAQMIRHPAECAGLRFEVDAGTKETLADVLQESAGRNPDSLPILEFTLDELFKHRTADRWLTFESYEKIGRLEGALCRRAEEVFLALPERVQASAADIFRLLVTVDPHAGLTGRRLRRAQVVDSEEKDKAVDAFLSARLLVSDQNLRNEAVIGLAHDALLRSWPRLRKWLEEIQDQLHIRSRLAEQAEWWEAEGRDPNLLINDISELRLAEEVLEYAAQELDPITAEYIRASTRRNKEYGRTFLWALLLAAGAVTIAALIMCLVNMKNLGLIGIGFGSLLYLVLLMPPVAIRLWRKHRPEPDLALLPREIPRHALAFCWVAAILISAAIFKLTAQSPEWTLYYASLALPAAAFALGSRIIALRLRRRGKPLFSKNSNQRAGQWLRAAEYAELGTIVLAALFTLTGLASFVSWLLPGHK